METAKTAFSDPDMVSDYAERTARLVPGLRDLHRMAGLLLAEKVPADGRVMVLGAGGGLELRAFAGQHPGWRFDGIDPSPEMLAQARDTLGPLLSQVTLHEGYVDDAPEGPFDGAACLLTLHFLPAEERLRTVREVHRRLRPGAPFVVAHHSFAKANGAGERWLARNAAFSVSNGVPAEQAQKSIPAIRDRLPVLSPDQDVAVLRDAGFQDIELFYAGFTFRGWVASRS